MMPSGVQGAGLTLSRLYQINRKHSSVCNLDSWHVGGVPALQLYVRGRMGSFFACFRISQSEIYD